MRFAAWKWAAVLAVCTVFTARMPEVYAKDAQPKAKAKAKAPKRETCVKLSEARVDEVTVDVTLASTCAGARECTIKWSVACEGNEATETEQSATLWKGDEETWKVSAAHCGDAAFVIAPPRFACRPPTLQ